MIFFAKSVDLTKNYHFYYNTSQKSLKMQSFYYICLKYVFFEG